MKISRFLGLAVLIALCSAMALADGIKDPKVIIRGVNGGNGIAQSCQGRCMPIGMNFSFGVPKGGSGTLFFTNTSGKDWTSLALIEKGVPASAVSCGQNLFMSCTISTLKNGSVEILLSGVKGASNPRTGIAAGSSFAIQFLCVKENGSKNCWPGGLDFKGHANVGVAPEPGTVALVVTGIGFIVSRRKSWKNRLNS